MKRGSLAKALDLALELAIEAELTYATADAALRRQLNQAFFRRVFIRDDDVVGADLAEPYASLLDPELLACLKKPPRGGAIKKDLVRERRF